MKVISVAYQAMKSPGRMALFITKNTDNADAAISEGNLAVLKKEGDFDWKAVLVSQLDLGDVELEKQSKNWLLKKIIDNKDKKLMKYSEKYLTEPERKFISAKLA